MQSWTGLAAYRQRRGDFCEQRRGTNIAWELANACAAELLHNPTPRIGISPGHGLRGHVDGRWAIGKRQLAMGNE